jgi:hypothetical protein
MAEFKLFAIHPAHTPPNLVFMKHIMSLRVVLPIVGVEEQG